MINNLQLFLTKMMKLLFGIFIALCAFNSPTLAEVGLSENWQLNFQDPATDLMSDIISFHSYVLMPIITGISILVLALLLIIVFRFNSSRNQTASTTTHILRRRPISANNQPHLRSSVGNLSLRSRRSADPSLRGPLGHPLLKHLPLNCCS